MNAPEIAAAPAAQGDIRTTIAFKLVLAWMLASSLGLIVDLAPISAALVDHQYVPVGPDSFYHARRILDAVASPGSFFQFDAHMHAPAGALVSWPWGYDYVMSLIVRAGLALGISEDPMTILVHVPVFARPVTLLFVIAACRALALGLPATLLALLGTVLFPLNQPLYSIGNIDHHYAEHMFVMASLAFGLRWLAKPDSTARSIIAGCVLGFAPAVHTGEFILQIPLLVTFTVMWLRGTPLPSTIWKFALGLIAATLAIGLPSLPLRRGLFDFLTLSWFQVYVSACTAVVCVAMWRYRCTRNSILALAALCAIMVVPIAGQALQAGAFLTSTGEGLAEISETRSLFGLLARGHSLAFTFGYYSYLILLVPLVLVICIWKLLRELEPPRLLLWISSAAGLLLLLTQIRLHYFGSYALFFPMLLLVDEHIRRLPVATPLAWSLFAVAFLAACSTGARQRFFQKQVVAGDPDYSMNRRLFMNFGKICHDAPGLVLAHPLDGNYLRFHTDCPVKGTNFLLTPADIVENREERALFYLPAEQIPRLHPEFLYIFVRRDTQFVVTPDGRLKLMPDHPHLVDPPLVTELLKADPQHLPAHYRLLDQLVFDTDPPRPYARVFALER